MSGEIIGDGWPEKFDDELRAAAKKRLGEIEENNSHLNEDDVVEIVDRLMDKWEVKKLIIVVEMFGEIF